MNLRQFLNLILLGTIWGASFLFIKIAVATVPPFTIVLARIGIAVICLYVVIRLRGRRLPALGPLWFSFLVMGLFNGVIPYSLINWGEQYIEAGLASIFNGLMPLFTILFAHFATRDERFSRRKGVGVVLGFLGLVVLVGPSVLEGLGSHLMGQLAVTGAAASYAVAAIYGKRLVKDRPLVLATGQMMGGTLLITPLSFAFDRPWSLSPTLPAMLSLLCLGVLGTAYAYILYYRLLAEVGAIKLSLVTYIIPVSGIFLGWIVLGERLHWTAFAGLGLILASIAAVGEMGAGKRPAAAFDPFGLVTRFVPERSLHRAIRVFMVLACAWFLSRRALEYGSYLFKPLWAVETMVYVVLIVAFWFRTYPMDRSRGLAEIVIPGVGALLPFTLLLSQPAGFVIDNRVLLPGVFWVMTLATLITVWGMWTLRRSFSITVEARELVTGGPYRFLRHPIYSGEILAAAAVTVWRVSWVSAVVFTLFVGIQLFRARMEEEKLARNFPDYKEYKDKVWWIWKV